MGILIGDAANLASIAGLYGENSYTSLAIADGSLATPISTDIGPAVNLMRWLNPDGSSGLSLGNYVFNTVWRPGERTSVNKQDVYGGFFGISGQNLNHPTVNHGVIALGSKANNAASTYIDTYGFLTLAYNTSTLATGIGVEIDSINETGATAPTFLSGLTGATIGLNLCGFANGTGSQYNSLGILLQSDGVGKYRTGIYFTANAILEYGIDLREVSAVPILLKNGAAISSRNAANAADVPLLSLNASNVLSLHDGTVHISHGGDGQSVLQVTNTNPGSSAKATINATGDAGAIAIGVSSSAAGGFANVASTVPNGVYHDYTGINSFAQFRIGGSFANSLRVTASGISVMNAMSPPQGGATGVGIKLSDVGNFGIFFGSGAPTLSAGEGSLYIRSGGANGSRAYINIDGSTGWAAILTAP